MQPDRTSFEKKVVDVYGERGADWLSRHPRIQSLSAKGDDQIEITLAVAPAWYPQGLFSWLGKAGVGSVFSRCDEACRLRIKGKICTQELWRSLGPQT